MRKAWLPPRTAARRRERSAVAQALPMMAPAGLDISRTNRSTLPLKLKLSLPVIFVSAHIAGPQAASHQDYAYLRLHEIYFIKVSGAYAMP